MTQGTKLRVGAAARGTKPPAKPKARSNREAKRSALLDEAAKIFNRRGISQASLSIIAGNVGISRAALYYYVDDQEDLVFQCYVRTCEQLGGLLDAASQGEASALEAVSQFVASALDNRRPESASLSDAAFLREDQRSSVLGLYKGVRASLADVISRGIEQGEIRSCNPRIVASVVLGLITWVPVALRWRPLASTPQAALRETVQSVLRLGIARERLPGGPYPKFDLSPFVTITGNVFDPEVRAAARRETLLASASWLFNQKGVDATSLEEVAERVGVTKKVIYHNMGGKDELVAECYRRAFRFFEFVGSAAQEFPGPRLDALCTSLATLASASIREDIAPLAPITGHDAWAKDVREALQGAVGRLTARYMKFYQTGLAEGSIRRVNAQALNALYPGFYEWMPRWSDSLRESERAQAPDEVANFLRLGLAPI